MRLASILDHDSVVLDVGTASRNDALARLAAPLAARRGDADPRALAAELVRREDESSTAIADGLCIPHARPAGRGPVVASFGRAPAGIDMGSFDGRPTNLFLVLVSPADETEAHVAWLAHVARVLSDEGTRRSLLEAGSADRVLAVLAAREQDLEAAAPARAGGGA